MTDSESRLKVFLCYSSNDKVAVRSLYQRFTSTSGLDPWLEEEKLMPGTDWDLETWKAVRQSHVVVVCLSGASVQKEGYVQKELRQALDVADEKPEGTIFLIPARLEVCEVPDRLHRWQWVDLFNEGGFQRLLSALHFSGKPNWDNHLANSRYSFLRQLRREPTIRYLDFVFERRWIF